MRRAATLTRISDASLHRMAELNRQGGGEKDVLEQALSQIDIL